MSVFQLYCNLCRCVRYACGDGVKASDALKAQLRRKLDADETLASVASVLFLVSVLIHVLHYAALVDFHENLPPNDAFRIVCALLMENLFSRVVFAKIVYMLYNFSSSVWISNFRPRIIPRDHGIFH